MSTNIGDTSDEQLAINVQAIVEKIDSGHWRLEDVIRNNQKELAFWRNKKCRSTVVSNNRARRIAYITAETEALLEHYKKDRDAKQSH